MLELYRIKNKIRMREYRKRQRNKDLTVSGDEKENVDAPIELEEVHDFVDLNEITDTDESTMDTTNSVETGEIPNVETPNDTNTDIYDENYGFAPISNEQDLQTVTHKIETNPNYLKNLRLQIVEESEDGICRLEQLFSLEFLQNYNMIGSNGRQNLSVLVPVKAVFFCKFLIP